MSDSWRPVAGLADLPPGSRKLVRIDGHSLLLFNVDVGSSTPLPTAARMPAPGWVAAHSAAPSCAVRRTGCMRGEAGLTVRVYPVRVEGEAVSVNLALESGDAAQAAGIQAG
jgi:hypothetical protein